MNRLRLGAMLFPFVRVWRDGVGVCKHHLERCFSPRGFSDSTRFPQSFRTATCDEREFRPRRGILLKLRTSSVVIWA